MRKVHCLIEKTTAIFKKESWSCGSTEKNRLEAAEEADRLSVGRQGAYTLKFSNGVSQHVTKTIQVKTPTGQPLLRETLM